MYCTVETNLYCSHVVINASITIYSEIFSVTFISRDEKIAKIRFSKFFIANLLYCINSLNTCTSSDMSVL